ncbi:diaminopimelate epimerase [Blastomonas aquatica]|uniref:Diaminopimelate epimerase n=1 Tax=Blastomonas aquatica TaxID=1510276 RepID=A0ABQ1J3S5_9SPHN|nr:diaminopimelate epimerase [Blastomonas aquatica]GGB58118.1 diaminopimelate epimerase [Blastomonas aquatica]
MAHHRFHKMHGLGNDFVIFDCREHDLSLSAEQVRALADRHLGIGCDQLIVMRPAPASSTADMAMQIFNHDGSEVSACGNATRCVVALAGRDVLIETGAGLLRGTLGDGAVTIDMGLPGLEWDALPLAYPMDTVHLPVGWEDLTDPAAVSMGNPHVIFFVDDGAAVDLERLGPLIEHDPLFPERVNVNIAHMADDGLHLRVWERGAGLTLACGTGACATAVAAIRRKLVSGPVPVHLPGGTLTIDWQPGSNVSMTGPTTHVFTGEIDF